MGARAPKAPKPAWRESVETLVWAAAIAILVRTFIMAPFKIPSGSMRPTLLEGDRIFVTKFTYHIREPERGEVIVFRYPENPKRPFIKRVVAMGGETVEIRDGHILVDGERVDGVPFVSANHYVNRGTYGREGQVLEVPPGEFYVLGDNSSFSQDSRFWGFVPERLVIGRAVCIWWPLNRIQLLR